MRRREAARRVARHSESSDSLAPAGQLPVLLRDLASSNYRYTLS